MRQREREQYALKRENNISNYIYIFTQTLYEHNQTQNKGINTKSKVLKKYVIVVYICKKTFKNMPYQCPILLILGIPKNAGTRNGCT